MKVGIAGLGFMGMVHYLCYQKMKDVEVVAIAAPSAKRRAGDWTDIKGNFGPPGEMMDLFGITTFADAETMIAEADIDMVDICLPPCLHAPVAIAALQAGKHVFCEKPIALAADDARRMVATASELGKLLMIGHVLAFDPEYRRAYEIVKSGEYGQIIGGNFKRVISDPPWLPNFYDVSKVGGPMLDLHVHDAHYIRLLFGMPLSVTSSGRLRGEVAEYWNTQFHFADSQTVVTATGGVINQQGRTFTNGFEIHLEKATLLYELAVIGDQPELLMPFTILDSDGRVKRPELGDGDPLLRFELELDEVAKSIKSGVPSPILSGEQALDAISLCHQQTESIRTGERVACQTDRNERAGRHDLKPRFVHYAAEQTEIGNEIT